MPTRTSSSTRDSAIRRVLGGILIANLAVVLVKFGVGIQAHSLAVFGDAIQSAIDAGNNIFGLLVMGVASKAPDEEHPYGHAKFETLGALLIAVLLAISIFELVRGAVGRLIAGAPPPEVTALGFVLLAATLVINVGVTVVERRAGERYRSELLMADALHTRVDVFITLTVMAGLLLARRGYPWADPVLAIIVAALVARAGFQIVRRTMPALVDERVYDEKTIRREAEGVPGVCSAYAIRSRGAPALRFAELTIAVDGGADVASAHRIADAVESRLREHLELHQIVVHVEPLPDRHRGPPRPPASDALALAAVPGVRAAANRGLQELDAPPRAAPPGRRGRGRDAEHVRSAVSAHRSAHARIGGPAHHEAPRAPVVSPVAPAIPQAA